MSAPGRAGRGAADQKFVKYLSESSNLSKKNANSIFFWNPRNEMSDSQSCEDFSSEGIVSGLRLGNIDCQSRLRLVFCTLLCDRTHKGECRTKPKMCQFSFLRNRRQSGYFDLALFLELFSEGTFRSYYSKGLSSLGALYMCKSVFFFLNPKYTATGNSWVSAAHKVEWFHQGADL